jgi:hypothetical protein
MPAALLTRTMLCRSIVSKDEGFSTNLHLLSVCDGSVIMCHQSWLKLKIASMGFLRIF